MLPEHRLSPYEAGRSSSFPAGTVAIRRQLEPHRVRASGIPVSGNWLSCRVICSGFVRHWPRQSLWPALSTTQIAVIFCETSNPTRQIIDDPPIVRITGQRRPDRRTIGGSSADRDYRMSTYDKAMRSVWITDRVLEDGSANFVTAGSFHCWIAAPNLRKRPAESLLDENWDHWSERR